MSDDSDNPILDRAAISRLDRLGGADFVRQMVELYLQHGPERIRALEKGVRDGDAAQIERAAHSLKSSAGNFGAVRLELAALWLESTSCEGTVDAAAAERVREEYAAAEVALRALLQELPQ
jgi:HPt (histidine-containing phosphotransfer) domain-containing protein